MEQLSASLLPSKKIILEYVETNKKISIEQTKLEKVILSNYRKDFLLCLFQLGLTDKQIPLSPSLSFWRDFSHYFIQTLKLTPDLENLREKVEIQEEGLKKEELLEKIPFTQGAEYLNKECIDYYWKLLESYFKSEIQLFSGSVEDFFHQYARQLHLVGRVFFHLVENKTDNRFPFAFMATYAYKIGKDGKSLHRPLKYAVTEYKDNSKKMLDLLSTIQLAGKKSMFIKSIMESGDIFHPLSWTAKQALQFLNEVDTYQEAGIFCRIPNWWKKKGQKSGLSLTLGDKKKSSLNLKSLVDFDMNISVDGTRVTFKVAKKLLAETEGLVQLKGKWINVDKESLSKTLDAWEKAQSMMKDHSLTFSEALKTFISPEDSKELSDLSSNIEVELGEWYKSLFDKMKNPQIIKSTTIPKSFKATLRPYQQVGLNWLGLLNSMKFGACLADDMGLGKTIQVIAFLETQKEKKALLVVPTSLISNWMNELEKFAPRLSYFMAHPSYKKNKEPLKEISDKVSDTNLIITTYGMVKKIEWIQKFNWDTIILDEAQAIKNPGTHQTKTICALNGAFRIALTGTPIENRLSDLWSLFNFLNPGILGTSKEFLQICNKLNKFPEKYSALRKVISPYILRRLKTDKKIISDLPEKIEMDCYSGLSKKQLAFYKDLVKSISKTLKEANEDKKTNNKNKQALILSSILKFKQICNHPDQYLGEGSFNPEESGKFRRLKEICETIYEKREKVLIFTQFKEIIAPLNDFLFSIFQHKGVYLHGGTSVSARQKRVSDFQSDEYVPYFILSIKAGGTGLNLTAANHVIHFDRWWNPAVENQATDRAFRIGQKNNVIVHKFITKGTIEEKISKIIEDKKELTKNIINTDQSRWINEMNNEEIIDFFKVGNILS